MSSKENYLKNFSKKVAMMSENECKDDTQKKASTTGTKFADGAGVTVVATAGTISSAVGAAALAACRP